MEWISVKDRLPDESGIYLVCVVFFKDASKLEVYMGYYDKKNKDWDLDCCTLDYVVSHWMSLPELPEVE